MEETFTLLPLNLDPSTKAISTSLASPALQSELALLNSTHRLLLSLDTPNAVPPPPIPLNPKRSAAIQKMRDQASTSLQKKPSPTSPHTHVHEAIKLYTYALEMALTRPPWEPAAIVRDEVAGLLGMRGQAYLKVGMWPEAGADAEGSAELRPGGNGVAWWVKGVSLKEMGRWEEAGEWISRGIESGGDDGGRLKSLLVEVNAELKRVKEKELRP